MDDVASNFLPGPTFGGGAPAGLSALSGAWKKIADLLSHVMAFRLFDLTALEEFGDLHAAELWEVLRRVDQPQVMAGAWS